MGGDAGPVEGEQYGFSEDASDAQAHDVGKALGAIADDFDS